LGFLMAAASCTCIHHHYSVKLARYSTTLSSYAIRQKSKKHFLHRKPLIKQSKARAKSLIIVLVGYCSLIIRKSISRFCWRF
jgi:hypothetical protein